MNNAESKTSEVKAPEVVEIKSGANNHSSNKSKQEEEEESLTPPLLPDMKLQESSEEKKNAKIKANQWDMFSEQDIFKNETNVRLVMNFIRLCNVICFRAPIR